MGDADHHLKALRSVLTRPHDVKPNQYELNERILNVRYFEPGSSGRTSAITAAEEYWITVGRNAGVLPFVRARKVHLPNDFLALLHAEAVAFTDELREWTVDEDVEDILSLLGVSPAADTKLAEHCRKLAPLWARVLRFPFLTPYEVQEVLNSHRGRNIAATNLLCGRLPQIARSTLLKRISKP